MSVEDIQQIIRRSVIDRAFAKALRNNFHQAVREYNLSPIEKAALKAMQIEFDEKKHHDHRPKHASRHKSYHRSDFYRLD